LFARFTSAESFSLSVCPNRYGFNQEQNMNASYTCRFFGGAAEMPHPLCGTSASRNIIIGGAELVPPANRFDSDRKSPLAPMATGGAVLQYNIL
jgi:hypothetical protein